MAEANSDRASRASPAADEPYEEAVALNQLGLRLKASGDYAAARQRYEAAMRLVGTGDSDVAATLLHNLAGIRFVLGDLAGAARCGRRGLAMRRRLWTADDPAVLLDEGNLAPILISLGHHDEAGRMLDRLLICFTVQFGPSDFEVAVTLTNLGALAAHRGDWTAARDHLVRADRIKTDCLGATSPDLVGTLANLVVVHDRLGEIDAARDVLNRAQRIARATMSATHPLRQHLEGLDESITRPAGGW